MGDGAKPVVHAERSGETLMKPNELPGHRYSKRERSEADWKAGLEIAAHEAAMKAAMPKPIRQPQWLNAMGADDYIKNRKLVEMHMTTEERDDMCRRASRLTD